MTCIHFDPKHNPARHAPSGKDLENQDYHDLIDKLADKVEDKVIAWRHDMHQNPELPNREFRTAKLIADHLKSLNLDEVRTGVCAPTNDGRRQYASPTDCHEHRRGARADGQSVF